MWIMKCHELPVRLRLYLLAHALVLPPVAWMLGRQVSSLPGFDLVLLLSFTVVLSTWAVELPDSQGRMTLAFPIICLAQLLHGLPMAVLCAGAGALAATLLPSSDGRGPVQRVRPSFYPLAFNLGNWIVACLAASLTYQAVVSHMPHGVGASVLSLDLFTAIYFGINTVGVAAAIALQQDLPWFTVWKRSFLRTAPGFFVAAAAAAGINMAHRQFGDWVLFVPLLYLIYTSYRIYMELRFGKGGMRRLSADRRAAAL
jgi:hypothetical protein